MTEDKETVERVALAIVNAIQHRGRGHFEVDGFYLYCSDANRGFDARDVARAAIEAMPKPTIRILNEPPKG